MAKKIKWWKIFGIMAQLLPFLLTLRQEAAKVIAIDKELAQLVAAGQDYKLTLRPDQIKHARIAGRPLVELAERIQEKWPI